MSTLTPVYSSTPSPLGRPGGPGLWRTKGLKLPDYIENVARGIMEGGVTDKSRAIATAIAAVKRWAAGGGKVSPEVRAAAAKAVAEWEALKASAHSHANEDGAAVSLSWHGQHVDLTSVDLAYVAPHLPAGSPAGGQFGTTAAGTNSGGTAGKTPAQQHRLHMAHVAHLQRLVAEGKATPAQKAELAGLLKALSAPGNGKPGPLVGGGAGKAAKKTAAKPKVPAKPKAKVPAAKPKPKVAAVKSPARPVVDRKRGTVTTVVNGRPVTVTLHQWHAAHEAHLKVVAARKAKAAKLAGDGGRFLDLAVADAIAAPVSRRQILPAERVPPGVREGGQFTARPVYLTRHDTPEQAAAVINGMGPVQRAVVRASIMVPPGFEWQAGDRLAEASDR